MDDEERFFDSEDMEASPVEMQSVGCTAISLVAFLLFLTLIFYNTYWN